MATSATGTPTTNYNIPTLQVGVDPPDGIGINNIVTAIDAAIKAAVAGKVSLGVVVAMGG